MITKTQLQTLKNIKIILTGKEIRIEELLKKIARQGKRQGLTYRQYQIFGMKLPLFKFDKVLELTKKYFNVELVHKD